MMPFLTLLLTLMGPKFHLKLLLPIRNYSLLFCANGLNQNQLDQLCIFHMHFLTSCLYKIRHCYYIHCYGSYKQISKQAVQLLVLFIRFQQQLHVESYKDSSQSSNIFMTEGDKKGNTSFSCLLQTKESQMSTERQKQFRLCVLYQPVQCSTEASCPGEPEVVPLEIFRKDETDTLSLPETFLGR